VTTYGHVSQVLMSTDVPEMDDVTEEKFFQDYVWARVTNA